MEDILNEAVRLLAKRAYSTKQLEEKLQQKKYANKEIEKIIHQLQSKKILNDFDVSNQIFEQYCRKNKYSLQFILQKLKQHGFSNSLINQILQETEPYNEYIAAEKLALQSLRRTKDPSKLTQYLLSRGFKRHTINQLLEKLFS